MATLAGVEHLVGAMLAEAPGGGHLHRRAQSPAAAHPDPPGVVTGVTEGRGAPGADPAVAAVVALGLLAQALLEQLAQSLHVDGVEHATHFRIHRKGRDGILQPAEDLLLQLRQILDAREVLGKGAVEIVEERLVLHQQGPGQAVEADERAAVQALEQRLHQCQPLGGGYGQAPGPQQVEEVQEDTAAVSYTHLTLPTN